MDLSRMKDDRKLHLCRWYFLAGFGFLPFLWAINTVWFYKEAFSRPPYAEQKDIKKYVIRSGIGALVWIIGILSWVIVFQTNRAAWGEIGDQISFIIPRGRA